MTSAHRRREGAQKPEQGDTSPISAGRPLPNLAWLLPGRVVQRYTAELGDGRYRAWLPCHERHSVTVPAALTGGLVRCSARSCGRAYLLTLEPDHDGGRWAYWSVAVWQEIHDSTTRHGHYPH